MLELLANQALMKRFLQLAALGAVGIGELIANAETTNLTGPEKRAVVINAALANVRAFIARGFIPPEALQDLEKTAGEVINTKVQVNNETGLFSHTETKSKKGAAK